MSESEEEFMDAKMETEEAANKGNHNNHHAEYDPGPGCRPCCSNPHGAKKTLLGAFLTTTAFSLSISTMATCHYMTPNFTYCFPSYSWRPREDETISCFDFNQDDVGLFSYDSWKEGGGLLSNLNPLPGWFESYDEKHLKGIYDKCSFYNFRNAKEGMWYDMKQIFGPGHTVAAVFSFLAALSGLLAGSLGWVACCVAFRRKAFVGMTVLCVLAGIFELLTLVFFSSDICEYGCTLQMGAKMAIASGVIFFLSAFLWWMIPNYDMTQIPIQCCCCPQFREEHSGGITEVELQRTFLPDGSIVTQKTTISTSGFKSIVRTTCLPDVRVGIGKEEVRKDANCETIEEDAPLLTSFATAETSVP